MQRKVSLLACVHSCIFNTIFDQIKATKHNFSIKHLYHTIYLTEKTFIYRSKSAKHLTGCLCERKELSSTKTIFNSSSASKSEQQRSSILCQLINFLKLWHLNLQMADFLHDENFNMFIRTVQMRLDRARTIHNFNF